MKLKFLNYSLNLKFFPFLLISLKNKLIWFVNRFQYYLAPDLDLLNGLDGEEGGSEEEEEDEEDVEDGDELNEDEDGEDSVEIMDGAGEEEEDDDDVVNENDGANEEDDLLGEEEFEREGTY